MNLALLTTGCIIRVYYALTCKTHDEIADFIGIKTTSLRDYLRENNQEKDTKIDKLIRLKLIDAITEILTDKGVI